MRACIATKINQCKDKCNSKVEDNKQSIEEYKDKEDKSVDAKVDSSANEVEEKDVNLEISSACFDGIEEIRKNKKEIKLRIKLMAVAHKVECQEY